MSDRKREILYALERIDYYGQATAQLKTELPITIELFLANQTNISRLTAAGITSISAESAGMSETRSKVARAREIEADLRRIVNTGERMEEKLAGFQNTFKLPRGGLSYQELIEHAESFIADAPAHQAEFSLRGLTVQFFSLIWRRMSRNLKKSPNSKPMPNARRSAQLPKSKPFSQTRSMSAQI